MGALELLNPRGLLLLLGLAPLIVLYILKIQRRSQRVPSTWLWVQAQRDLMAKQPFRRLIAELPLILQILALALLALALARPAARSGRVAGDHVAIVIDTSASMGAALRQGAPPGSGTRMSEAKQAGLDVIGALAPGADAIVIEAGREARVASPLERDARRLRASVAQLSARDVEGDLAAAVALGAERLRSLGGKKRLVVITDGALAHDAPLSAAGVDAEVVTVGDDEDNAAIVRIDVRSGIDPATKRDQAQVFAMVKNYAKSPRDAFVTLTVDRSDGGAEAQGHAEPVASRRVLIPPGEKVPVVLTFEPSEGDRGKGLWVQIAPGDALTLDDVAYGRVPASRKMPVVLASRAPYSWLARALDADPDVALQRITVAQLATVNVDPDALVVIEGACIDAVPGHDLVVVAPPLGTCLGVEVGEAMEQPQLTSWESGDPRMRFLTLDGVHVARANALGGLRLGAALARAGGAAIVADASVPGRTVTVLGFDPGDSDWPLKASFVIFVRNVVEQARLHRAEGAAGPVRTGDPLRWVVPSGVTTVRVEGPGTKEHEVPAKGGLAVVPSIDRAGLYHVRWTEPTIGDAVAAANLTSERESDIRPRPVAIVAAGDAGSTKAGHFADAHREWGGWLALAAAFLIALDICWLTRRARPRRDLAGGRPP
jgi:hypothetical protein